MTSKADITNSAIHKFKWDIYCVGLLLLLSPLFFYKLGQSSLVSWDEAWYGEIARNILKSGDLFNLFWNGTKYYDHPPAGFWMIALSEKLLGISDFSVRFPAAVAGLLTLITTYFLGKTLFNRVVGFCAALALSSSFWFIARARSGNLDSFLVLFFLLTLYFAFRACQNRRFLIPFSISLGLLSLTKTLVPLTVIPPLIIIFWKSPRFRLNDFFYPVLIYVVIMAPWFLISYSHSDNFLQRYLMIGYPGADSRSSYSDNVKLTKEYIHNGIGRWFWLGTGGIIGGAFLLQRRFLILISFAVVFVLPFIFSSKGQIWHLLPLHPILILSFLGFTYVLMEKIIQLRPKVFNRNKVIISIVLLIGTSYIWFYQARQAWYQFIDIPAYISDEAILSKESQKYPGDLYIDGADFGPTAVFYSEKKVYKVWEGGLQDTFKTVPQFVMITHQWRLDGSNIPAKAYRIIKKDRDKILIQKV